MRVKDFLHSINQNEMITFIKLRARKDAHSPFYHPEYQTVPLRTGWEWLDSENESLLNSVVLNDKQPPLGWKDDGWQKQFSKGHLKCLLVVSQSDFELLYPSKEQREHSERFIEAKIKGLRS